MFIIRGKSLKVKISQSPLEESRKRPGHGERDSSKFSFLITKRFHIEEMLDYIVVSSFDVRVIR